MLLMVVDRRFLTLSLLILCDCLPLHVSILHNEFLFFLTIIGDVFAVVSQFVLFLIIWRNPILIKICSVFSFLISLVADPSFPLYLIVSCGKFLSFQSPFQGSGYFFP